MLSSFDARFPVAESWIDAVTVAARTLERRRDGLRLVLRLAVALTGLAAAAELARHPLRERGLEALAVLLVGLAAGASFALALVAASTACWHLRFRRLLRMSTAHELPSRASTARANAWEA